LAVILFALFACTYGYSITGDMRNEFLQEMVLVDSSLTQGTFTTAPQKTISVGSTYNVFFVAEGDSGVEGTLTYTASGASNVVASFYFENLPNNQTSISTVNPPPWIGGVSTPTGTASDVTFFFWTHEMCVNSAECY
jgi:hypothetical protein